MFKVSVFEFEFLNSKAQNKIYNLFQCAEKFNKFWKINKKMYCNIGGLAALVFLMTRTEEMP